MTGRSLYSCALVIPPDFPADYLIFSNGAGIFDLTTDRLLSSFNLQYNDIAKISSYLIEKKADFMVHDAVPQNHSFIYHFPSGDNPDFSTRLQLYKEFARDYTSHDALPRQSAQIIVIFFGDTPSFSTIETGLEEFQITRTTSPFDGRSLWMEIGPKHVSKGQSAQWLCDHLKLDRKYSLGVGNDYNDISLLQFTGFSFVVDNAPEELRRQFSNTTSNDNDGFYLAIQRVLPGT